MHTDIIGKFTGKFHSLILLVFLLALHLPFITADPDVHISIGRDAHTDEGLYSYQVRNFINHGDWTLKSSDCLLKTPLFELLLFPSLKLFGTDRAVARVFILLLSLLIFLWMLYGYYSLAWIVTLVTLSQYYIFHYLHYSMSDTLSTICIFAAVALMCRLQKNSSEKGAVIAASVFISLAYYIKVQYIYMLFLLPLVSVLFFLFKLISGKDLIKYLKLSGLVLSGFLIVFCIGWVLPNYDFFKYVISEQTAHRFPETTGIFGQLNNNVRFIFLNDKLRLATYIFFITYLAGLFIFIRSGSVLFRRFFLAISAWLVMEGHKLFMTYLPSRYLISIFFACGVLVSLVLWEIIFHDETRKLTIVRILAVLLLVTLVTLNGYNWYRAFNNRTWFMEQAEKYLSDFDFANRPVAGAWATAIGWRCKAITFPVWINYFNDTRVLEIHQPAMIISEDDEGDSGGAFRAAGVDIREHADSVKNFRLLHWKLKLYWIKSPQQKEQPNN